jgi:hypothetical protein
MSSNPLLVSNSSSSMVPKSRLESMASGKRSLRPQTAIYGYLRYSAVRLGGNSPKGRDKLRTTTEMAEFFIPHLSKTANPNQRYQKGRVNLGLSLTATKLNSRCVSEPLEDFDFEPARVIAHRQQYCKRPISSKPTKINRIHEQPKVMTDVKPKIIVRQHHFNQATKAAKTATLPIEDDLSKWHVDSLGETIHF